MSKFIDKLIKGVVVVGVISAGFSSIWLKLDRANKREELRNEYKERMGKTYVSFSMFQENYPDAALEIQPYYERVYQYYEKQKDAQLIQSYSVNEELWQTTIMTSEETRDALTFEHGFENSILTNNQWVEKIELSIYEGPGHHLPPIEKSDFDKAEEMFGVDKNTLYIFCDKLYQRVAKDIDIKSEDNIKVTEKWKDIDISLYIEMPYGQYVTFEMTKACH